MLSRIAPTLCAGLALVSLSGCGSSGGSSVVGNGPSAATAPSSPTTAAPTPAPTSASPAGGSSGGAPSTTGSSGSGGGGTGSSTSSAGGSGSPGSGTAGSGGGTSGATFANRGVFGMNLDPAVYWETAIPFADAFKLSAPLASGRTLLFNNTNGHFPAGDYVVTWTGSGSVALTGDATTVKTQAPNRVVVTVTPGIHGLAVTETGAVSGVHVWLPGLENAASPFNPTFVQNLAAFGALRFLNWGNVDYCFPANTAPAATWATRTLPTDDQWGLGNGVPFEIMIDLCNELGANPWICIPHLADDDFVRNLAQLLSTRLHSGLTPYVEYSNETWNGVYPQASWVQQQGLSLGLSTNQYQAGVRFYSQRAVAIFAIFEQVYGGTGRFTRVLGTQYSNTFVSTTALTWQNAWQHVDALAVAPYFELPNGHTSPLAPVGGYTSVAPLEADVLSLIDDTSPGSSTVMPGLRAQTRAQAAIARQYGLKLVAYEGGQSLVGGPVASTALCASANHDPGMATLYQHLMAHWMADGGGMFVLFENVRRDAGDGTWAARQFFDETPAQEPKWQAILDFVTSGMPF